MEMRDLMSGAVGAGNTAVAGALGKEGVKNIMEGNVGLGIVEGGVAVLNAAFAVWNETYFMQGMKDRISQGLLNEVNRAFSEVRM